MPHPIAEDVRRGLTAPAKSLPPHLFYDEEGSSLYEQITELEEYYLTRTERAILARHAPGMVALAAAGTEQPLSVIELGAGSADKTRLILSALVAAQKSAVYLPVDVSPQRARSRARSHRGRDTRHRSAPLRGAARGGE